MSKRTVYTKSNASGSSSNYYAYPISLPREPWEVEEAEIPDHVTIINREETKRRARRADVRHNT
jgi:hypothetical protein